MCMSVLLWLTIECYEKKHRSHEYTRLLSILDRLVVAAVAPNQDSVKGDLAAAEYGVPAMSLKYQGLPD